MRGLYSNLEGPHLMAFYKKDSLLHSLITASSSTLWQGKENISRLEFTKEKQQRIGNPFPSPKLD